MTATILVILVIWAFLVVVIGLFMAAADFCNDRHDHADDSTNDDYLEGE